MKTFKLFIVISLVLSLLCSCSSTSGEQSGTAASSTSPSATSTPSVTSTPAPEYNIPNEESLIQLYTSQITELTDSTILSTNYEDFKQDDLSATADVIAEMSDGRILNISALYSTNNGWGLVYISNNENSHYYYIPDNYKTTYDLYDYKTDQLLSKDRYVKKFKLNKVSFEAPNSWDIKKETDAYRISNESAYTYINVLVNKSPDLSLDKTWDMLKKAFNNYSQKDVKDVSIGKKKGKQWHFTFETTDGTTYDSIYCIVKNGKKIYVFSIMQMWALTNTPVFDAILQSVEWKK